MRATLLAVFLLAGCNEKNPNFCADQGPDHLCAQPDAAPESCSASEPCTTGVCKDPPGVCVECLGNADCLPGMPICTTDNRCSKCTSHSECLSRVCRTDGQCEGEAVVAYVDGQTGTDTAMCTLTEPCKTITTAATKGRSVLKLRGMISDAVVFGTTQTFSIYVEPGTAVSRTGGGPVIEIKDTANIEIHRLEIVGSAANTGVLMGSQMAKVQLDGVRVTGNGNVGIQVSNGGLTLVRSNIINNLGGGVQISGGTFVIVGNTFTNNGSDAGAVGGVNIVTTGSVSNRLEFNSFHRNKSLDAQGTAIQCAVSNFTAKNNILFGNGTVTNMMQHGGACMHSYSLIMPGAASGTNITGDPMFVDGLSGDLHVKAGSPVLGQADPSANVADDLAGYDIDRNPRTLPADIGADEAP